MCNNHEPSWQPLTKESKKGILSWTSPSLASMTLPWSWLHTVPQCFVWDENVFLRGTGVVLLMCSFKSVSWVLLQQELRQKTRGPVQFSCTAAEQTASSQGVRITLSSSFLLPSRLPEAPSQDVKITWPKPSGEFGLLGRSVSIQKFTVLDAESPVQPAHGSASGSDGLQMLIFKTVGVLAWCKVLSASRMFWVIMLIFSKILSNI